MTKPTNLDYISVLFTLSFIISFIFFFSQATGLITQEFYTVFFPIVSGVTVAWLVIWFMEKTNGMNQVFVGNETVPGSELSRSPLLFKIFAIGGGLAILFSMSAVGLGSPIIDIPQPFTQQAFSQVTDFDKIFYQSVIPGFFEESAIYFIVLGIKFILFMSIPKLKRVALGVYAISAFIGALVLMQAHRVVYGSDVGSYLGILSFEFIVQFFNLYIGAFISWIPHMVHNAVVVMNFLVAFSIGGVAMMLFHTPIIKSRKGNSAIVLLVILVLGVALIWGIRGMDLSNFSLGNLNFNVNTGSDGYIPPQDPTAPDVTDDDFHLGNYFEDNWPTYFAVRSAQCEAAGGDWISNADQLGCYDVPVWDYAAGCSSAEVYTMRYVCINLAGIYTCNAHEVSCEV